MTLYRDCYRRAEILERWASIYLGKRAKGDFARLEAARLRLWAEIIKAWRLEEIANWVDGQLARNQRIYAWLSR